MLNKYWLALGLAVLATRGAAQDPSPASDEEPTDTNVCIGTPTWRPTLAEAAAIATEPVPAAFSRLYELREPCLHREHNARILLDFHLNFGTAQSIGSVLAYVERLHISGEPAPEAYRAALERAWRRAEGELSRARAVPQPADADYSARHRFMETNRPIRRFAALRDTREKYIFLANQYLRAAEEFGSLSLLGVADRYLRAAVAGSAFLAPLEGRPPVQNLLSFDLHRFITDDLEMRAAVLRAGLTRRPGDLAAAERIFQAQERPHYRRLAERAFSGGDDFCDVSGGHGQAEELEETCRREDDDDEVQARVVNQLLARAALDLLVAAPATGNQPDSYERALGLLDRERLPDRSRCCRRSATDDIVRLRLAGAAERRRRMEAARDTPHQALQFWSDALGELREAERLIPPFSAPARFRRVAESWLATWAQEPALTSRLDEGDRSPTLSPDLNRYATYLRRTLESLDAIAAGRDAGLPAAGN